jgi:N-acetylated-alpha-linked acidic dipeptidase
MLPLPSAGDSSTMAGFSPTSATRQREIERRLAGSLSTERIEAHLERLSRTPHPAGSKATLEVVDYLQQELGSYGLETEMVEYVGFLPAPISVSLELVEPHHEVLRLTEDRIDSDPFTEAVSDHPGWSGYSPSGLATGQVVYGHYGSEADLERLRAAGIDLAGKILLLRNFGTGEGRKVANAERFGAAGVVLYTDPAEDGYPFGSVYPEGNWRPAGSIMRRSVFFAPYEGDPLSPGWASKPGAKRLTPQEVPLPGIPVVPVSYRTAEQVLSHLRGPEAPGEWQGALPLTYRLGPGPAKLRLTTKMDNRDRPMRNVLAWLKGESATDQWIVLGNHHDAWIYGAGDPSSGTAALLELARALGELARAGIRPQRTLVIVFWDAEEMVLGGSTEWVEDRHAELLEKAVACINMDSAVFNPDRPLSISAHPALHRLFRQVAKDVPDPRTGHSTWQAWLDLQNRYRTTPGVDGWGEFFNPTETLTRPYLFETPYDDAAPFFGLLALPASDMYYGADYGMYHSIYENFHWMKTVVDPDFTYHRVMAQLQGFAALRLANADLLPLDFVEEARLWRLAYDDLATVAQGRDQEVPRLDEALELLEEWHDEAVKLRDDGAALLEGGIVEASSLEPVNQKISRAFLDFYRAEGHPGMPGDRNLFAGSSYDFEGISGSTLPGLRFSLDRGDLDLAAAEVDVYIEALAQRVATVGNLRRLLQTAAEE